VLQNLSFNLSCYFSVNKYKIYKRLVHIQTKEKKNEKIDTYLSTR
jgi:hypothetical protein